MQGSLQRYIILPLFSLKVILFAQNLRTASWEDIKGVHFRPRTHNIIPSAEDCIGSRIYILQLRWDHENVDFFFEFFHVRWLETVSLDAQFLQLLLALILDQILSRKRGHGSYLACHKRSVEFMQSQNQGIPTGINSIVHVTSYFLPVW